MYISVRRHTAREKVHVAEKEGAAPALRRAQGKRLLMTLVTHLGHITIITDNSHLMICCRYFKPDVFSILCDLAHVAAWNSYTLCKLA